MITISYDETVKLWNLEDYSLKGTLEPEDGYLNTASLSPCGKKLIVSASDSL